MKISSHNPISSSSSALFDLTQKLVQKAERKVLTFQPSSPFFDVISRNTLFPFLFIQLGIAELFQPLSKSALTSFGFLIVASFLIPNTELPAEAKSYIFLFCIYGPIFWVTFAVPSTFAFDSIKGNQIQELVDFIYAQGIDSKEKIEALEENLSIAAERTYARVKTFQWIIATLWALFLYGLNQFTNLVLKMAPDQISTTLSDNLPTLIIYVVVSLFSIVVIVGYKKSNDAVFRRLQFALQELKYRIATNHVEPT